MKRQSKTKKVIIALIFFALIGVGAFALNASGNWENPFAAFSTTSGEGRPEGDFEEGVVPSDRPAMDANAIASGEMPGNDNNASIQLSWSQFGHVLYNVWFLFAAAGVVMLISQPLTYIRKQVRHQRSRRVKQVLQAQT